MGRSSVLPWGIIASLCLSWGCNASPNRSPLAWLRGGAAADKQGDQEAADNNPFGKKKDAAGDSATVAESGKDTPENGGSKIAMHAAETLRLIDEETRNLPPEERRALFEDLKHLEPAMVRNILKMREMVRTMGQDLPSQPIAQVSAQAEPGQYQGRNFAGTALARPTSNPFSGVGHSTGFAREAPAIRQTSAGLGTTAPWNRSNDRRYPAITADHSVPAAGYRRDANVRTLSGPTASGFGASNTNAYGRPSEFDLTSAAAVPDGPMTRAFGTRNASTIPRIPTVPGRTGSIVSPSEGGTEFNPRSLREAMTVNAVNSPGAAAAGGLNGMQARFPSPNRSVQTAAYGGPATSVVPVSGYREDLQKLISLAEADAAEHAIRETNESDPAFEQKYQAYLEKQVHLRLLYLMAGEHERAMQRIADIEPADQEFWTQMFWAMANYFDFATISDDSVRAAETVAQLRSAVLRLQERAQLQLRNVNFCHKISSFGNYERFQRDEFRPGQAVLLYAEVSNFTSKLTSENEYRTRLRSSIEIYRKAPGGAGELVEKVTFPATEDLCHNHRQDYFHSYEFSVPQRISLGPHILKLTVIDELGNKVASDTVNFTVN